MISALIMVLFTQVLIRLGGQTNFFVFFMDIIVSAACYFGSILIIGGILGYNFRQMFAEVAEHFKKNRN
jgi:hypothetical protein